MGLDLYIETEKYYLHKTTGVFIRENGANKELKTIEEVKAYFKGFDISHIKEYEYMDNIVWKRHITHNLTEMADHVRIDNTTLYLLLWRPIESGYSFVTKEYVYYLNECLELLIYDKDELVKYNPENGFGNYNTLLDFVKSLVDCLNGIDVEKEKCIIHCSV